MVTINLNTTTVGEIATTQPITVSPDENMTNISKLFEESTFHHLPVIDESATCVGMISKSDFYQLQDCFTKSKTGNYKRNNELLFRSLLASEVMTKNVVSLNEKIPIMKAINIFLDNKVHSIAIIKEGKLYGILTPYDILKELKSDSEIPDGLYFG